MGLLLNPSWLLQDSAEVVEKFKYMRVHLLWDSYSICSRQRAPGCKKSVDSYVLELSQTFEMYRTLCLAQDDVGVSALLDLVSPSAFRSSALLRPSSRHLQLANVFQSLFGQEAFHALCIPTFPCLDGSPVREELEHFLTRAFLPCDIPSLLQDCTVDSLIRILTLSHPSMEWRNSNSQRTALRSSRSDAVYRHIAKYFTSTLHVVVRSDDDGLVRLLLGFDPFSTDVVDGVSTLTTPLLARRVLDSIFGSRLVEKLMPSAPVVPSVREPSDCFEWPAKLDDTVVIPRLLAYYRNSQYHFPSPCAVCGCMKHGNPVSVYSTIGSGDRSVDALNFRLLDFSESGLSLHVNRHFLHPDPKLNGKVLDFTVIRSRDRSAYDVPVCSICAEHLGKGHLPKFALANGLYRGTLPQEFQDLTWIEEAVCAIFRSTAIVTRLYGGKDDDPRNPFKLRGNTCAHQMNVTSTANALPRTPEDVAGMISIVFIGTAPLNKWALRRVFRVRRRKIWRFLRFLKMNNPLYEHVTLDPAVLAMYPDDSTLPGLGEGLIHVHASSEGLFEDETSGFTEHPASSSSHTASSSDSGSDGFFFERTGATDPEGSALVGRHLQASAVKNLSRYGQKPDLLLSNSAVRVNEYDNSALLPGMFPTCYPYGIGGFDSPVQRKKVSFRMHVDYLLDSNDAVFRTHNAFIFIVLDMWRRRQAHFFSYLTVSRDKFDVVAERFLTVSKEVLTKMSKTLAKEGKFISLSDEERRALELLHFVNGVSIHVPGSQAKKLLMRNEVVAYSGFFGIPTFFLTINPCAQHSPIFQVMCGDLKVDLSKRYPQLVPSKERAIRLANDPVAGADFFHFSVTCLFRDLLGWDFDKRSASHPGILGTLAAFYGTTEFTNRGQLHGHFLLWVEGAPNPSETHLRLEASKEYQSQFFGFFEDVIKHDLPDVHCPELANEDFDCRTERPEPPPIDPTGLSPEELEERIEELAAEGVFDVWRTSFRYDVKKCGEKLQRHTHREVCQKYKKNGKCRFLFPHEVVESSYYDAESKSIVLAVRDSTVNFYNPYILVFCRHNHDIKFILSGRGAKAAMFYITDYITKMDVKTCHVLSLLARAVCEFNELIFANGGVATTPLLRAKRLLSKCISQFSKLQEIHAQQAVRYMRGLDDCFKSHETVTMASKGLLKFVRSCYNLIVRLTPSDPDENEEPVRVVEDNEGRLVCCNQVSNFFHRDDLLSNLNFYDFVRCFKLKKKTSDTHGVDGVRHFTLKRTHPLAKSHMLVRSASVVYTKNDMGFIPRVFGMSVPKLKSGDEYYLFMLAHFKPFGVDKPLLNSADTLESQFRSYPFNDLSLSVMDNWTALTECQDARDAEQRKKNDVLSREAMFARELENGAMDSEEVLKAKASEHKNYLALLRDELQSQEMAMALIDAGWCDQGMVSGDEPGVHGFDDEDIRRARIVDRDPARTAHSGDDFRYPTFVSHSRYTNWRTEMKRAEEAVARQRRCEASVADVGSLGDSESRIRSTTNAQDGARETVVMPPPTLPLTDEMAAFQIEQIRMRNGLNERQSFAFRLIVDNYLDLRLKRQAHRELEHEPLRLFLTGPGGTGKTHVVNCVKEVMGLFNAEHRIRFLAPTGSAASLISGLTIHSGLGIKVSKYTKGGTFTNVHLSVSDKVELREEWKDVDIVLVDEVSLISLTLLCELDHALRFVKEKPDVFFGGVTLLVSGDVYQLTPVRGYPVYSTLEAKSNRPIANLLVEARLGKLAWDSIQSVVELTEQVRMQDDPQYAAAVLRLRVRKSTQADVDLFNTRVIRDKNDVSAPGVALNDERGRNAVVLVDKNAVRIALNTLKAKSICAAFGGPQIHLCEALDRHFDKKTLIDNSFPQKDRDFLLNVNTDRNKVDGGIMPSLNLQGRVPLYVGMPVMIRERNISTDLNITNGSTGVVKHITFKASEETGSDKREVADVVFVHIPRCPVRLQGLPPSVVPIGLNSTTFCAVLPSSATKTYAKFQRQQMIIQPGFAITLHCAQGQTCPDVVTDLRCGGFLAYVAASRVRTRQSLFIAAKVCLAQLLKPLPIELENEQERLSALAHNTLVRAGVLIAPLKHVPRLLLADLESVSSVNVVYHDVQQEKAAEKKRAASRRSDSGTSRSKKKRRVETVPLICTLYAPDHPDARFSSLLSSRCKWRSDYSCAYDCTVVSLILAFVVMGDRWREDFTALGDTLFSVSECFTTGCFAE